MTDIQTILLAFAGWLATTWLAYRWGLRAQKIASERETKMAIRNKKVAFVAFIKSWVHEFSRKNYVSVGWERNRSAFFDGLSEFIHNTEYIQCDIPEDRRSEFDRLRARIKAVKNQDFYKDKFEHLLKDFDDLIRQVEES